MFELKTNEEIGSYLRQLILSKYPSCRQFCVAYIDLTLNFSEDSEELRSEDIRKLTNRLSQILKGKKGIQTYDLPIFSELLGVSCEQMLSAGAVCKPFTNRRTNYNIAFSTDERVWIEYINRKDCIVSYADEFGKTVVDYAIEFNNYDFIKFLIKNGYISLVTYDKGYGGFNLGASTSLKTRPFEAKTLEGEMYENKTLRTQIITLALKNSDYNVLEEMKARIFPPQLCININNISDINFSNYYDEKYIEAILCLKPEEIQYFCEEYYVKTYFINNEYLWIFPFMDKLIVRAVESNNINAITLLEAAIKHNEASYKELKNSILSIAKELRDSYLRNWGFQEIIAHVFRGYNISKEKNVISFYSYDSFKDNKSFLTNIIYAEVKSYKPEIQIKINKLNDLYNKIINIENHLLKNNSLKTTGGN